MSFICLSYHIHFSQSPTMPPPASAAAASSSKRVTAASASQISVWLLGCGCFQGRQPTCPPPMVGNGGFMWANDATGCEKGWENGGRSWVMVESVEYWVVDAGCGWWSGFFVTFHPTRGGLLDLSFCKWPTWGICGWWEYAQHAFQGSCWTPHQMAWLARTAVITRTSWPTKAGKKSFLIRCFFSRKKHLVALATTKLHDATSM